MPAPSPFGPRLCPPSVFCRVGGIRVQVSSVTSSPNRNTDAQMHRTRKCVGPTPAYLDAHISAHAGTHRRIPEDGSSAERRAWRRACCPPRSSADSKPLPPSPSFLPSLPASPPPKCHSPESNHRSHHRSHHWLNHRCTSVPGRVLAC